MSGPRLATLRNGSALPLAAVPDLPFEDLRDAVVRETAEGNRLVSFFASVPEPASPASSRAGGEVELLAVVADDEEGTLGVGRARLEGERFPSLTPACPQAHWFEREIAEQAGVVPAGHPWLKPIRFHSSWREGHDAWGRPALAHPVPGVTDFYRVEGEEVHEVAVGPVHAGVIEPGHFRFQCHGEEVFHLEISLGYQHRDVERALAGGPHKGTVPIVETIAGDTTVAHAWAYAEVVEALAGVAVPARAGAVRGVALELERLANHVGDLGALANDVGFLPTASFCGRIRGDFLNMTALLCGSRFGRGLIRPGGVGFALEPERAGRLAERLVAGRRDALEAIGLLWETASVTARFEGTGVVSPKDAEEIGLVGPAARACGIGRDVRHDHPHGIYRYVHLPVVTASTGDVAARAAVRAAEVERSADFVAEQLAALPETPARVPVGPLAADSLAVALVEGWRGEVCHVALTDGDGRFRRYKVTDPSFHNWFGLALALRGEEISNFPLCNKSFNLSYCGHDL